MAVVAVVVVRSFMYKDVRLLAGYYMACNF